MELVNIIKNVIPTLNDKKLDTL